MLRYAICINADNSSVMKGLTHMIVKPGKTDPPTSEKPNLMPFSTQK